MDWIKEIFESSWYVKVINSIIVILVSIIVYRIVVKILNKSADKVRAKLFTSNKGKTYANLIKSVVKYIFIIITLLILFQINGVNVSSALTGVGIVGVVFGLAIQDWLKDIIRGSSIISDDYFKVGDIVRYKDVEGKVLALGLKTTKILELKTGYIKSIANRNIDEIDLVSNLIYLNVPMPYELEVEKAEGIVNSIAENIKSINYVTNCTYVSVNELSESFVNYYLKVECEQLYKFQVRRDAIRTILVTMEQNNVSVPYTQIDIHEK